jgi:peptide/nickel transport system substrate-binding protein
VNELIAAEADFVHQISDASDIDRLKDAPHLNVVEYASNTYNFIGFNLRDPEDPSRPHPLFGNREIRRAVSMAVNRTALTRSAVGEYGLQSAGPLGPSLWIWGDEMPPTLPFDSVEARSKLAELGWADSDGDGMLDRGGEVLGFELVLPPVSVRRRGAEVLQEQMRRFGIRVDIAELDFPAFFDRLGSGRFDAHYSSLGHDPSPSSLKDWSTSAIGGLNYGSYSSPEFDRAVETAMAAPDRATALTHWYTALETINEDAPAVWLYVPKKMAAVHTRFGSVSIRPDQFWHALWTWQADPANLIERDLFSAN